MYVCINYRHWLAFMVAKNITNCREKVYTAKYEICCKIWGFHGGDYEECRLLGCEAMFLKNRHFGGTYRLHYQGEKSKRTKNNVSSN
jgi:hypothetical protein